MLEPSGEGKGERSRTVILVEEKGGRVARERAVERPKTPEPIMRIDEGVEAILRIEDQSGRSAV